MNRPASAPPAFDHAKPAAPLSWSSAVKVSTAVVPSSTVKAVALVISGVTDRRVKVRVAIGSSENLPVALMLVIVPRGEVAAFDSENSVPSSVPASYGYKSTLCDASQSPCASSNVSPETPTNQSGLGATIVTRVTRG